MQQLVAVELDMAWESEQSAEDALASWLSEWEGVEGEVLTKASGNGWPVVRLSGELAAVWPVVVAYAGGDEGMASELMS